MAKTIGLTKKWLCQLPISANLERMSHYRQPPQKCQFGLMFNDWLHLYVCPFPSLNHTQERQSVLSATGWWNKSCSSWISLHSKEMMESEYIILATYRMEWRIMVGILRQLPGQLKFSMWAWDLISAWVKVDPSRKVSPQKAMWQHGKMTDVVLS